MSQITTRVTAASMGSVLTLTPDAGGSVSPDGAGNIDILGGNNITTTGTLNTVTIDITGTTDHAVQIGNATGSLTSVAVGTDGQVLIGATGADPAFATLTSTDATITFTPGVNTLDLSASGAVGVLQLTGDIGGSATDTSIELTAQQVGGLGTASFEVVSASQIRLLFGDNLNNIILGDLTANAPSGSSNTGIGWASLRFLTSGISNCAYGASSLNDLTSGITNCAFGTSSLGNITTGVNNTAIGDLAGINYTTNESSNICINSRGVLGESNTLRIGVDTGTFTGFLNAAFIQGIFGITPAGATQTVIIDADGQLGSVASSSGFTWNEEAGTSANMAVNNGYIANNASLVTLTLPSTASVGDVVRVTGKGAGGWRVAQNAGQTIYFGSSSTTTGATGYLEFTDDRDGVELICVTTDNDWNVLSSIGNITVN